MPRAQFVFMVKGCPLTAQGTLRTRDPAQDRYALTVLVVGGRALAAKNGTVTCEQSQ